MIMIISTTAYARLLLGVYTTLAFVLFALPVIITGYLCEILHAPFMAGFFFQLSNFSIIALFWARVMRELRYAAAARALRRKARYLEARGLKQAGASLNQLASRAEWRMLTGMSAIFLVWCVCKYAV